MRLSKLFAMVFVLIGVANLSAAEMVIEDTSIEVLEVVNSTDILLEVQELLITEVDSEIFYRPTVDGNSVTRSAKQNKLFRRTDHDYRQYQIRYKPQEYLLRNKQKVFSSTNRVRDSQDEEDESESQDYSRQLRLWTL